MRVLLVLLAVIVLGAVALLVWSSAVPGEGEFLSARSASPSTSPNSARCALEDPAEVEPQIAGETPRARAAAGRAGPGAGIANALPPGGDLVVTGTVTDARSALPISGALVQHIDALRERATTDVAGRFRFLAPKGTESMHVLVTAPGYAPRVSERLVPVVGQVVALIRLDPGVVLVGRVLDATGAIVAGANVRANEYAAAPEVDRGPFFGAGPFDFARDDTRTANFSDDLARLELGVDTGPDGRFRLAIGLDRNEVVLHVRVRGRGACMRVVAIPSPAPGEIDLGDLVLEGPRNLKGRISWVTVGDDESTATPIAGAEVRLRFQGGPVGALQSALEVFAPRPVRSASDGRFEFDDLVAGVYTLSVTERDRRVFERRGVRVDGSSDSGEWSVVVRRMLTLPGRVLDENGLPVRGAQVSADVRDPTLVATTDAEGRFELGDLERKPVALVIRPPNDGSPVRRFVATHAGPFVPAASSPREVVVTLESARTIDGRVFDEEGRRLARAAVVARSANGDELDVAYADDEGRFVLHVPPSGRVELVAWPSKTRVAKPSKAMDDAQAALVGLGYGPDEERASTSGCEVRTIDTSLGVSANAHAVEPGSNDVVLRLRRGP